MRILLDAHFSDRRIGIPLRESGHDVLALGDDDRLPALPDEHVLRLAASEERIVVTRNVRHFAPILRRWAEAGRSHAGCILVTFEHAEYARLLLGLGHLFEGPPVQDDWVDRALFLA
ncbi:MAG: DUF5615 family PIN-like protein [Actinobacteria bacterium]|nr:DUF5615 family PIN-like protein [Actinomycetota bacterium]